MVLYKDLIIDIYGVYLVLIRIIEFFFCVDLDFLGKINVL